MSKVVDLEQDLEKDEEFVDDIGINPECQKSAANSTEFESEDAGEDEDDELAMGMTPTPEQLEKINQWIPANAMPLAAKDVITIPIIASNNLLQWSNECWHPDSIEAMAKTMPGRVFMINHGDDKGGMWGMTWDSVKTQKGRIYDARHMVYDSAPEELINCAGNGEANLKIIEMFGYHTLEMDVFFERGCEIAKEIRYGTHLDVSTGTVGMVRYLCPMCSDFQKKHEVEFVSEECPHYPPTNRIMEMIRRGELEPEQEIMVAPFIIQDGVDYSIETSSVCTGNLPSARIVNRRDILEGIY